MARYRRGGRGRRGGSGATAPAQSAVHSSESRQDSTGFHAGSSGHSSRSNPSRASHPSESNPSRAGQQGSYSALVSDLPAQEDEYPVAPQDSNSSEILAHAFIRGFRARTIKSLLRFIQRRATTTTGDVLEIREVLVPHPCLSFACYRAASSSELSLRSLGHPRCKRFVQPC